MVNRRKLTEEFVDSVSLPESGELWIADTVVRGFGLRLWSSPNTSGRAFAIRVTNTEGRSVRKTYDPWLYGRYSPWDENYYNRFSILTSAEEDRQYSEFARSLRAAREWARTEIGRLKGKLPTAQDLRDVDAEYEDMRSKRRAYLEKKTLGEVVEIVLEDKNRAARGWTVEYADRWRHAFDQFDTQAKLRDVTFGDLADGRLTGLIEASTLSPGNLRSLRSLLNVVLWKVHHVGGPAIGHVFPGSSKPLETRTAQSVLDDLAPDDFDKIIEGARTLCSDWRAAACIELCFHFYAPVTRIMAGRWSSIIENRWYPYSPDEGTSWYGRWERINGPECDCLIKAAEAAQKEGLRSDFFFPSPVIPDKPIANIDRTWFSLLSELGLPRVSLKRCATCYRRQYRRFAWSDPEEDQKITAKLSKSRKHLDLSD